MKNTFLLALLSLSFIYVQAQASFEWGTYLPRTDTVKINESTIDPMGNLIIVGITRSPDSLHNGHQAVVAGMQDGFILKMDQDGNQLWGTYFGGAGGDGISSVETDALGNIYVCGSTNSNSGVASNGFLNTYQGLGDAFVAKFSPSGSLLWSTYYGGNDSDGATQIAVNNRGEIFIAGITEGDNGIAHNGHQNTPAIGFNDAFLVKFDSTGNRIWGTYYGGTALEERPRLAVDTFGNVFLCGYTESMQNIGFNGHQNNHAGQYDVFIAKFDANGVRQWGTYYGGSGGDGYGEIAVDLEGNVYYTGYTDTPEPVIATAGAHQTSLNDPGGDAFIVKFDSNGTRLWGTYFGGNSNEGSEHIAIGPCGNIYIAGTSRSTSGLTYNGFQNTNAGESDFFVAKFSSAGDIRWASFLGGSDAEFMYDLAIGTDQSIFCSGGTVSHDLPFSGPKPDSSNHFYRYSSFWKLRDNYVSLSVSDSSLCANASPIQLVGNPSGGVFSGVGVQNNLFDPTGLAANQSYLLTYSHTDTFGCPGMGRVEIMLNPQPTVSFSLADTLCEESKAISLNGFPLGGIYSGLGITDTFFDPSTAGQGIHQLSYFFTDSNACTSDTIIETVLILPNPTPVIQATGDTLMTNLVGIPHTWYLDGVALPDTGAQIVSQSTGVYTVVVDHGYCGLFTSESFTHIQTSLEVEATKQFKAYWLEEGQLVVDKGDYPSSLGLSLWDLQGRKIWNEKMTQKKELFVLPTYTSGIYILQLHTTKGDKSIKLLIP